MSIVDGELTTLATCWRIERLDGAGLALTSHDQALTRNGIRHEPSPRMSPAAVTRNLGLEPHSAEIRGALTSDALSATDLALGRWDGAGVELCLAAWADPAQPEIALVAGMVGSMHIEDASFSAELTGAAARLERPVCPSISAECRAEFGDPQCRVDLAGRTVVATVAAANGASLTIETGGDPRFLLGRLRFLSGANCGLSTTILSVAGNMLQLRDAPRAPVETGCRVELREGCDKRFATCVSRFANAANFRGEPHLPGMDLLTRYPGA